MKLNLGEDSSNQDLDSSVSRNRISLPQGLFGFSQIRFMDLMFDKEELPFMWLREEEEDGLAFVVIEPGGVLPDYSLEIADGDINVLGITGPEDTMILNIVTLLPEQPSKISLNLVGPIIVNRKSLVGKQCIINNHEDYSARHIIDVGNESL
jgi:flagellar assembly factor FliW